MPIPIQQDDDTQTKDGSRGIDATQIAESFPALEHFRVQNIPPAAYYIPDFISPEEEEYLLRKIEESPQPKWKKVGTGRRLQYWGGTMSKNGILLPEALPDFLTSFPNIIERIESFLRVASSAKGKEKMELGMNQVLVNEYLPGQGISPHEDGPAFHPLVATLSLGSHTVLDLHHYINPTSPSPPMIPSNSSTTPEGKTIAAIPLAHLLLMPRSLLVLSSSLYTSHLHSISSTAKDIIVRAPSSNAEGEDRGVMISNTELLGDPDIVDALTRDGRWVGERTKRISLTFRRAEKVLKGGLSGALGKSLGLKR
ncbi:hypothetical protein I302_100588 [Kwoniella bestiolae CBS 10118]|uniref:Fe2OG dioxygenase domain-containing protein n=1 Tax=Kwoniella bestiolae CBS 10118 TaxID=1296100 RepID=A0A1B9G5J9_9TREE|nr:hypothetical protein I302_03963 [Kwoniella bestiolae CBS 10118]OCF26281.1 hypothetical protein I302_03963 [Kwoniella bestiolae CBS 10118]